MKGARVIHRTSLALFLLLGPIFGCAQVVNSPCANLNATVDIKPRADLALGFGNDAIKAAIDAVMGGLSQGRNLSVSNLTESGKEAALSTAKGNGKNPSADDMAELDRYLSRDVIPAIKQNPTCNFTVTSSGRPYVGIESVIFEPHGKREIPHVGVKNTGLSEARIQGGIQYVIDGKSLAGARVNVALVPGQSREIWVSNIDLPMPDIEAGKVKLGVNIFLSYPVEGRSNPVPLEESWVYDHESKMFVISPRK